MTRHRLATRRGWRLLGFATGDFAFNLYWQSMMLYLLFYYTEALRLPLALASLCYALAMAWDGIVSLLAGLWVDRNGSPRAYRRIVAWGSLPLGLCFALAYAIPPVRGAAAFGWVMAGHLLVRTAYALVNIPYLAMSAQITRGEDEQALMAGWRMLAGTLAAVVVALGTTPLGGLLAPPGSPRVFAVAAIDFALVGTLILWLAVAVAPPPVAGPVRGPAPWQALASVWQCRSFPTLMLAMMAMITAATMIDKSVLYYFKYQLHDQHAGELTLGAMMATGGIAVPLWMAFARRWGTRAVWLVATGLGMAALLLFAVGAVRNETALACFLVVVQLALVGLNFAIWAMLPGVIEQAEARAGLQMGAVIYGYSALLQRLAIGLGTLLVGATLDKAGQAIATGNGFRLAIVVLPLALLGLSGAIMHAGRARFTKPDRPA